MPTLKNKGKIRMALQDHAALTVNDTGTDRKIDTPLTQLGSRDVLRDLIVMRETHGAHSAAGHHLSNLGELVEGDVLNGPAWGDHPIQDPRRLLERQADGLQRALSRMEM